LGLLEIILAELIVILALVTILLVLLIWWLIRKLVVVPALTVQTDKAEYMRGETVQISGSLMDGTTPLAGKQVALAIQPPTGDAYSLPSVTTGTDGKFASSWTVPADAVGGDYGLVAGAMGVSATTTFKLK